MSKCRKCDKISPPALDGNVQVLNGFEENEHFVLCFKCFSEFHKLVKRAKTKREKNKIFLTWLKKCSEG